MFDAGAKKFSDFTPTNVHLSVSMEKQTYLSFNKENYAHIENIRNVPVPF